VDGSHIRRLEARESTFSAPGPTSSRALEAKLKHERTTEPSLVCRAVVPQRSIWSDLLLSDPYHAADVALKLRCWDGHLI
jgi:hypothetical protein